jgi:hypothetical protein
MNILCVVFVAAKAELLAHEDVRQPQYAPTQENRQDCRDPAPLYCSVRKSATGGLTTPLTWFEQILAEASHPIT